MRFENGHHRGRSCRRTVPLPHNVKCRGGGGGKGRIIIWNNTSIDTLILMLLSNVALQGSFY